MAEPAAEFVVLVDEGDRELGTEEKLAAHRQGLLHRAFSVFVVRVGAGGPELLLQQRAPAKYHFGGLWSNTCCGHPRAGEDVVAAGRRRTREELGLECALEPAGSFVYRAEAPNGLIEHELDHVLIGWTDAEPQPDAAEVAATRWVALGALEAELRSAPVCFSPWLAPALALARAALTS